MIIEEREIGNCYSRHDDAIYKVIAKGEDWVCFLSCSYNHFACTTEITGEEFLSDLNLETDSRVYDIFDNLVLDKFWKDSLKIKGE